MISSLGAANISDGVVNYAWSWQLHFILCQPIVPQAQGTEGLKQPLQLLPDKPWHLANFHVLQIDALEMVFWGGDSPMLDWDASVLFQLQETECI